MTIYNNAAFSAFVDLYLAAYPTVVLCKLRLSLEKKIGLSIALGFGFVWVCDESMTICIKSFLTLRQINYCSGLQVHHDTVTSLA